MTQVSSANLELKEEFIDYIHQQIWQRKDDINSILPEYLVIYYTQFLKLLNLDLLQYLPKLHKAVIELVTRTLRKLTTDQILKILIYICESVLATDLILKVEAAELIILCSIVEMGIDRSDPVLSDSIQRAIQNHFPEFALINKNFIKFFETKRKDVLVCHFFMRLVQFHINIDENDRNMLIQNMEQVLPSLKVANASLEFDYSDLTDKIRSWKNKKAVYKDYHDFRMSYYNQNTNYPPMMLSPQDLYRQFASVFSVLMTDAEFIHKSLMFAHQEFEKRSDRNRKEVKNLCQRIDDSNTDLSRIKKNRRQNPAEIGQLEASIRENRIQLQRFKYEYFKPLKKALFMLACTLEYVRPNKQDSSLEGIGKIFNTALEVNEVYLGY